MHRLTKKLADGTYVIDDVRIDEITSRLAAFENAYDEFLALQNEILAELEQLRTQGKVKSVKFKEFTARKVMVGATMNIFKAHGIE